MTGQRPPPPVRFLNFHGVSEFRSLKVTCTSELDSMLPTSGIRLLQRNAISVSAQILEFKCSCSNFVASLHNVAFASAGTFCVKLRLGQLKWPTTFNYQKRVNWSIRNSADGRGLDPLTNSGDGRTRLIRIFQDLQFKLKARIQVLRKDFPKKFLFFLMGFYCATAFATVIGQTGDWDILSAGVAVAVVEGIGALMYKASVPLLDRVRNLIVLFNYWKAGLTLGLFLDSFKLIGLDICCNTALIRRLAFSTLHQSDSPETV